MLLFSHPEQRESSEIQILHCVLHYFIEKIFHFVLRIIIEKILHCVQNDKAVRKASLRSRRMTRQKNNGTIL